MSNAVPGPASPPATVIISQNQVLFLDLDGALQAAGLRAAVQVATADAAAITTRNLRAIIIDADGLDADMRMMVWGHVTHRVPVFVLAHSVGTVKKLGIRYTAWFRKRVLSDRVAGRIVAILTRSLRSRDGSALPKPADQQGLGGQS